MSLSKSNSHNDASAKRGSEQVWCFDKKTDKVFPVNIRGVMSGTQFCEVKIEGETLSLEEPLSQIEALVSHILTRVVQNEKLADLTKEDRFSLTAFSAVQLLRTQTSRDRIKDLNEGVAEVLRKRGIDPAEFSNFKMLSEDEIKAFSMDMLAEAPRTYGRISYQNIGTSSERHPAILFTSVMTRLFWTMSLITGPAL